MLMAESVLIVLEHPVKATTPLLLVEPWSFGDIIPNYYLPFIMDFLKCHEYRLGVKH